MSSAKSTTPCPHCGGENEPGTRFCTRCGGAVEAQAQCPSCKQLQPAGNQFCLSCGAAMQERDRVTATASGAVVDGVWQREAGEFIRRVDPEDARTFLGGRVVRVPAGTAGVVLVDGVVDKILPPGERTTLSLFERVRDFFTARAGRTAFYLVDSRPIPIPFTVETRPAKTGQVVQTQVVVSFSLQRGNKEGIASFIANVLGDRPAYAAGDLYSALRPDVIRAATSVLERLATSGEVRFADAEAEIRRELQSALGARYGLGIDVSLAPLTTTASVNLHLGTGQAPRVRNCEKCKAELPATMGFCDRCGHRQPTLLSPERVCAKCGANVPAEDRFCNGCGVTYAEPSATSAPLFTADGKQVEIDLVVRVSGSNGELIGDRIAPALASAVAAYVRGVALARLSTGDGFTALEEAMRGDATSALLSHGLTLASLSVVDVREKSGQWLLGARADLDRARTEAGLGREWLTERAGEIDLAELSMAQALRQQRVERQAKLAEVQLELAATERERSMRADDGIAREKSELDERQRRQAMAAGAAELDVTDAKRGAERQISIEQSKQSVERSARDYRRETELGDLRHDMTKEDAAVAHDASITRQAMELDAEKKRQAAALDSERARQTAEDSAYGARAKSDVSFDDDRRRAKLAEETADAAERRQLEKLRAMAELDRAIAAQDHAHEKEMRELLKGLGEREIIAMQATELAKTEGGGAAWAQALSGQEAAAVNEKRLVEAERHATEMRELLQLQAREQAAMTTAQLDRMQQLTDRLVDGALGQKQGAASAEVYGKSLDAMSRVATSRAAPVPVIPVAATIPGPPCKQCGAALKSESRFCGACGTEQ